MKQPCVPNREDGSLRLMSRITQIDFVDMLPPKLLNKLCRKPANSLSVIYPAVLSRSSFSISPATLKPTTRRSSIFQELQLITGLSRIIDTEPLRSLPTKQRCKRIRGCLFCGLSARRHQATAATLIVFIQHQRLLQCHTVLSDPENRKSILSVAEEIGFTDAPSFGRACRRECGHSPRDVKSAAEAGMPMDTRLERRGVTSMRRFYDLIN